MIGEGRLLAVPFSCARVKVEQWNCLHLDTGALNVIMLPNELDCGQRKEW